MKVSWILFWIVCVLEIATFAIISLFLWFREVDATGATQTFELKLINIAVIAAFFIIPFIIQIVWAIVNIMVSKKHAHAQI
ncbi:MULTISPECIES: DUF3923 family protein [Staphylococcus]|uniref:DUF3923 family protein n=1 Tax=Staphylococcus hsinchuensis TaxID=3051183 RepID=A0ABZ3EA61_9STAP|nr:MULTISPECIES: DUF3923 family protein [unclassified Staphylococcus]